MNARLFVLSGLGAALLLSAGCDSDGLTNQQRFALKQQESRQNHEWRMAALQLQHDSLNPTTAPATP